MTHSRTNPNPYTSSNQTLFNTAIARPYNRFSHFLFHELDYQDAVSLDLLLNHIAPGLSIQERNDVYAAFESVVVGVIESVRDEYSAADDARIDAEHEVNELKEKIENLKINHKYEIAELEKKTRAAYVVAGKLAVQVSAGGFHNLAKAAGDARFEVRSFGRTLRRADRRVRWRLAWRSFLGVLARPLRRHRPS